MTEFELALFTAMVQMLPELLQTRSYGIYELAQEFAGRSGQPIYEVMTPLAEALKAMLQDGQLSYDRDRNRLHRPATV